MTPLSSRAILLLCFGLPFAILLGWHQFTRLNNGPETEMFQYKAPFPDENSTDELIIPLAYVVHLSPGRSVDELNDAIARDINPFITGILNPSRDVEKDALIFSVSAVEDDLLASVRAWRGVKMVERDYRLEPY
ncbi:hypothetical protein CC79DRAFT_1365064 [Sarocladium strictum]